MDSTRPRLPVPVLSSAQESRSPFRAIASFLSTSLTGETRLSLILGFGYLLALVAAEGCAHLAPQLGFLPYGAILLLLVLHTALCWDRPLRSMPLILALVTLARLVLLLVKPATPFLYLALALGIPIVGAGVVLLFPRALLKRAVKATVSFGQNGGRAAVSLCRSGGRAMISLYQNGGSAAISFCRDGRRAAGRLFFSCLGRILYYSRENCSYQLLSRVVLASIALLAVLLLGSYLAPHSRALATGMGPLTQVIAANVSSPAVSRPALSPSYGKQLYRALLPQPGRSASTARRSPAVDPAALASFWATWEESNRAAWRRTVVSKEIAQPVDEIPPEPSFGITWEESNAAAWRRTVAPEKVARPADEIPPEPPSGVTWEESNGVAWRWKAAPEEAAPPASEDPSELASSADEGASEPSPPASEEYPECPSSGYENWYPQGVCTWYAKEKRPDLPWFYGDYGLAVNWAWSAERCGFYVDQVPAAGDVIVFPPGANGAYGGGHVGYVEEVTEDSILISECNVTHDASYSLEPWWWEAGYPCAFRRISFSWLDSRVQFIHGRLQIKQR